MITIRINQPQTRKGKGFVYKLLVNRASNTICVRFQQLTQNLYKEYVIVREKRKKKNLEKSIVVPHTFNHNFQGYIVRFENYKSVVNESILCKTEKDTLIQLACAAIKNGKTFAGIKGLLQSYGERTIEGKYSEIKCFMQQWYLLLTNQFNFRVF